MTLVELSFLMKAPRFGRTVSVDELFDFVQNSPHILVLPISVEIAREAAALRPILIEPADCIIAATARVHGLRLLTADQRIIAANLVSTIE